MIKYKLVDSDVTFVSFHVKHPIPRIHKPFKKFSSFPNTHAHFVRRNTRYKMLVKSLISTLIKCSHV